MPNTGNKIYTELIEVTIPDGDPTGFTKPNHPSDPDYIPPVVDTDHCPIVTTTTTIMPEYTAPGGKNITVLSGFTKKATWVVGSSPGTIQVTCIINVMHLLDSSHPRIKVMYGATVLADSDVPGPGPNEGDTIILTASWTPTGGDDSVELHFSTDKASNIFYYIEIL